RIALVLRCVLFTAVAIAVVVRPVVVLRRGVDGRVVVVGDPVAVLVDVLVVADLGGIRVDRRIVVVAVEPADRVAVGRIAAVLRRIEERGVLDRHVLAVPVTVEVRVIDAVREAVVVLAVAVLIDVVADFRRARVDRRVVVVAVVVLVVAVVVCVEVHAAV